MKCIHVIDSLGIGGAERVLAVLLPELEKLGVSAEVAVLREPYTLAGVLEQNGIRVHSLHAFNKWNLPAGAKALARLAREGRFDIVHAHLLFPGIYAGLFRMFGSGRAKTCITFHNLAYAPGCNKPGVGLAVRKGLNKFSSRYGMDAATAVSQAVADHYKAALGLKDITVIPNPVPVAAIDRAGGTSWQSHIDAGSRTSTIILPGRMVHEKGHVVFIEALSILKGRDIPVQAVFAGDGPLRQSLEAQIAASGLSRLVRIAGLLPYEDLLAEIAAADIVVVPSLFEGFGLTAAEAMSLKKPVVAARSGGLIDVIEDGRTGMLVEPGNARSLADAISNLLADPEKCKKLGEAGRHHIEQNFDAPIVAAKMIEFYKSLLRDVA